MHVNTQDRIINSVTGFEAWTNFAINNRIDPGNNTLFIRGLVWNITVPHYGRVFFDAGLGLVLVVGDEFTLLRFAGLYDVDEARLCAAMDQ